MKKLFCVLAVAFGVATAAIAQDLQESLSRVGESYAQAYVQPLTLAIASSLNSGLIDAPFRSREPEGFHLRFAIRAIGTSLGNGDRFFDLTYTENVRMTLRVGGEDMTVVAPADISVAGAPTIFGSPDVPAVTVSVRYDTTLSFIGVQLPVSVDSTYSVETVGGLVDTKIVPAAVPELEVGTLFGTQMRLRWLPRIAAAEVGQISLLGLGFRHSLSQYFPELPLTVTLAAHWHRLTDQTEEGDDLVTARTSALGLAAGRSFGPVSLYTGAQVEEATVAYSYSYDISDGEASETIEIDFDQRTGPRFRYVVGMGIRASGLLLTLDTGFSTATTLSAGVSYGF